MLKCIRTEKGARIVHYPLRAPSDLLPSLPPSFLASCPLSPSLWAVKQYKGNPRHDSAAYCDPPASAPIGQCDMHCGTVNARNDGVERGPCSFSARFYKVHVLRSVDLWVRMSVKSRAFCCATARVSPLRLRATQPHTYPKFGTAQYSRIHLCDPKLNNMYCSGK